LIKTLILLGAYCSETTPLPTSPAQETTASRGYVNNPSEETTTPAPVPTERRGYINNPSEETTTPAQVPTDRRGYINNPPEESTAPAQVPRKGYVNNPLGDTPENKGDTGSYRSGITKNICKMHSANILQDPHCPLVNY
jgi:hypothetical protein